MRENYEIYDLLGKNIRNIRKNVLHKTQKEVAEDIKRSTSFIIKIENQKGSRGISIDTLAAISKAYNIDIRKLFDGYEKILEKNKH